MKIEDLIQKLSQYGTIQVIKEGVVFSVVITGSGLTKSRTITGIQGAILEYVGDRFPLIEAMKNDENFFCMILRPKIKSEL